MTCFAKVSGSEVRVPKLLDAATEVTQLKVLGCVPVQLGKVLVCKLFEPAKVYGQS